MTPARRVTYYSHNDGIKSADQEPFMEPSRPQRLGAPLPGA